MEWSRGRKVLSSEQGLLELADRRFDMSASELLVVFRDLVSADMDWADNRKRRFRRSASRVRLAVLALSTLATIILGIQEIPARASIALPFVAVGASLAALESFFNWRSRWVLMEETQYRLNRLRDDLDFYLLNTPAEQQSRDDLRGFYEEQQTIWGDVSRRWIEFRRLDTSAPAGQNPGPGPNHP